MTVSTKIEIELRCNRCDTVLCVDVKSHSDEGGTYLYVEPCPTCSKDEPEQAEKSASTTNK